MEHYVKNLLKYVNYYDGVFIEAGANNGITQSYTYFLEKNRNWKGILIEPSIISFEECICNRSKKNYYYNCALVSNDDVFKITGDFDSGSLMSSIGGNRLKNSNNVSVNARTITSILNEINLNGKIDLFSLDVEGYELEVLKGLDFNKYSPNYLVIEVYNKIKDELFQLLMDNNYELISNLTGYNKKEYPKWDGTHNDFLFKKIK